MGDQSAILNKVLALKESLRQEMAKPEYQEVKKAEREIYLKNLNVWRAKAHELYRKLETAGKVTQAEALVK